MKSCDVCGARYRDEAARCPLDGGALRQLNDPLIGRTIAGRYILTDRIGAGGMGTVYRARHEVVGRDVAIKFLAQHLSTQPSHRTRFLREARAANRINHEHIIDITDCGETSDGLVYLVMEFLDGVPLSAELRERGPLPIRRALLIALQLARALGRAHDLEVVHRDIKPENIHLLRGYDGDFVKILDFGLAHMRGELRLTASGTVFGTPEYMSPEQVRGAPITASSDLYSLGVVMFEMLAGAPLFSGRTPTLILNHMRTPPRPPSTHRAGIPVALDMLVLRLLAKSPEDRPRSAHALADELKLRLGELPGGASEDFELITPTAPRQNESTPTRATQLGTGTLVAAWRARVSFFKELSQRAHGHSPPADLAAALERLTERVETMAAARDSLARRVAAASEQEDSAREARLRIGRALDELSQDAGRLTEQITKATAALAASESTRAACIATLAEAWRAIPACPDDITKISSEATASLRRSGELSHAYDEATAEVERAQENLALLRRQHEDLEFQMGQLKGRMASLNAVTEFDLDEQRAKTAALDAEIEREIEEVVRESASIVQHFLRFPELREMVRAAEA